MDKLQKKTLVGVYASAMTFMAMLVPVPIIASIVQTFPDENIVVIQMIVALPSLLMALAAMVVSSMLAQKIYKKHLALFGGILFMCSGLVPIVVHNSAVQLLIAAAFVGIGLGILQNSTDAIIADYFEGKQRSFVMGFFSTFVALGGIFWMLLSANLGATDWTHSYYAYFFMIPFLAIAAICLPKGKLEPKREKGVFAAVPKEVALITLIGFLFTIAVQLYNTNVSLLVVGRGMGGTIEAGFGSTAATMAGLVAGFLVGPAFSKLKNRALPCMFCITLVGLVICLVAPSLIALCIGGFVLSLGCETFTPLEGNFAAGNSLPAGRAFNLAIGMAGMNFGKAVSPIVAGTVCAPFGGTIESKLVMGIVICALLAVFGFIHYSHLTPAQAEEQKRIEEAKKQKEA